MNKIFSGLQKIHDCLQQSLKTRLQKSLSHDWIPDSRAHKFYLRQYYVQLEWKKKIRTAFGSRTEILTSIHDLIKQLTSAKENKANMPAVLRGKRK